MAESQLPNNGDQEPFLDVGDASEVSQFHVLPPARRLGAYKRAAGLTTIGIVVFLMCSQSSSFAVSVPARVAQIISLASSHHVGNNDIGNKGCVGEESAFEKISHLLDEVQHKKPARKSEFHKLRQAIEVGRLKKGQKGEAALEQIEIFLNEVGLLDAEALGEVITMDDMRAIAGSLLGDCNAIEMDEQVLETQKRSKPHKVKALKNTGFQTDEVYPGYRWSEGRVNYCFHSSCAVSKACTSAVRAAAKLLHQQVPCISFKEVSTRGDKCVANPAIIVHADTGGCWSSLGMTSWGKSPKYTQRLGLSPGCQSRGIASHEFIHALGVSHEQTRSDRDKYVTIRWDNIPDNREGNFRKSKWAFTKSTYDLLSVMQYGASSFSTNGELTIEPQQKVYASYMGQREGLSEYDVKQLCEMYECNQCHPIVNNGELADALASGKHPGANSAAPHTEKGCTCKLDWQMSGKDKCATEKNGGCCCPDNWKGGDWCYTDGKCEGKNWDHCEPADVAPNTKRGCRCKAQWSYKGHVSSSSTGNCHTFGYEGGPWCYIESDCINTDWDYCIPK